MKEMMISKRLTKQRSISLLHSAFDMILSVCFCYNSQWIIVLLFSIIILFNICYLKFDFLERNLILLKTFKIDLFHSTAQILPLSLSIAYYNTNDRFIDIIFLIICISFIYHLYLESNKMSLDKNNDKILIIMCLCVILDYIQIIILVLNKLYLTNNYYFYKFIFSSYPVTIGAIICMLYSDLIHYGIIAFCERITISNVWKSFGILLMFVLGLPLIMECANASWIIFLYNEFFRKLRNGKDFNEKLKDELVKWLQENKNDLLIKICCINHIELLQQHYNKHNYKYDALLNYLQNNIEQNVYYYKNVTWYQLQQKSDKFNNKYLKNTLKKEIVKYYDFNSCRDSMIRDWNQFKNGITYSNFHNVLQSSAFCGLLMFFMFYAIMKILNIFIWPLITLWITYNNSYNTMTIHEMCFNIIYFILLLIILYKLYHLIRYEMIMWSIIPELDNLKCSKNDIDKFMEYYKYITNDLDEMRCVLSDVFGKDVAQIILLHTPDCITLYKENKLNKLNDVFLVGDTN